jgi:hypothetical protein
MKNIKGFLISGIGHIIAEEVSSDENGIVLSWPAIVMVQTDMRGTPIYGLGPLIPEYYKSNQSDTVKLPLNSILIRKDITQRMINLYEDWKSESIQKRSGLVIPTKGRANSIH